MSAAFGTRVQSKGMPKGHGVWGAEQPLPCQGSCSLPSGMWEKGKAEPHGTQETQSTARNHIDLSRARSRNHILAAVGQGVVKKLPQVLPLATEPGLQQCPARLAHEEP